MAHHTQDDGFHEIQLNGKQLVFLFMAATVVSVVIFLCGVLVGRGVVAERAAASAGDATMASADTIATPMTSDSVALATSGDDPTAAAPPMPVEDLSFFERLEKPENPEEDLKPASETAAPPAPAKPAALSERKPIPPPIGPPAATARSSVATGPASAATRPPAAAAPSVVAPRPPDPAPPVASAPTAAAASPKPVAPSGDFAVQVAALKARTDAEGIAKRLSSKGYEAYVVPPGNGAVMYRVRVGHFKTRGEAETVSARLQKEEQFKPWITR